MNSYRNPKLTQSIWRSKERISSALFYALDNCGFEDSAKTSKSDACNYFIDYISVFLIKKPIDLIYIFSGFGCGKKDKLLKSRFMKMYFSNYLVDNYVISAIFEEDALENIGDYEEWVDIPLRMRAKEIIERSKDGSLSCDDLIPKNIRMEDYIQEYILAWAFEENKLSAEGIAYFSEKFNKKFLMLSRIKSR
jgi:hypothetical protein